MRKLILVYWGTVFLMHLSHVYYPTEVRLSRHQSGRHHFLRKKTDIFMIAVIFWLSAFSFLRTSYNDTYAYIYAFNNSETIAEGFQKGIFTDWTSNPWSELFESLMKVVTDNYHVYFMVPAFLSSFSIVKLIKRYSVSPEFSLLIFFSIGTYVMYIAALKQCMAMFFLLMALPYALDKKYVKFYLLVVVACLFHIHAFMFAIVPFLVEKPWGKVTWFGLAFTLFAMATYDVTLGAFMEYAQSLGANVAESEVFDGHSINVLRVLVYWVPALLALLFRRRLFADSSKTENLFANMGIVSSFILSIGLVEGANMYARMAAYFELATAITLPWMIKKLFTKQSAQLVSSIAVVLYFVYFMFEFTVSKNFDADYASITLPQLIMELLA